MYKTFKSACDNGTCQSGYVMDLITCASQVVCVCKALTMTQKGRNM
jgi:hypothetical protein